MQKRIIFDKFVPYHIVKNEEGTSETIKMDFSNTLRRIVSNGFGSSLREINREKYRLNKCKFHSDTGLWEMQILHLRNALLPGMADETDVFEKIPIPDDRYVAESSTVVFDVNNLFMYLQRNIQCITALRFADYLRQIIDPNVPVYLEPVIDSNKIDKVKKAKSIKKLILVHEIANHNPTRHSNRLWDLISASKDFGGKILRFELGGGRSRKNEHLLITDATSELIEEALCSSGTMQLKVGYYDDDNDYTTIDMLKERETIEVLAKYEEREPITHDMLYRLCSDKIHAEGVIS